MSKEFSIDVDEKSLRRNKTMLSDEEKKAIEVIKGLAVYYDDYSLLDEEEIEENEEVNNSINIVLNLIEKQSKEIEELKEDNKHQWEERCKLTFKLENSTSNDKIKAKIEEIENEDKKYKNYLKDGRENFTPEYIWARPVLKSLLEKE